VYTIQLVKLIALGYFYKCLACRVRNRVQLRLLLLLQFTSILISVGWIS